MLKQNYKNPASRKVYEGYINNLGTLPVSFVYDGTAHCGFDPDIFKESGKTVSHNGEKEETIFTLKAYDNLTVTIETAYYDNYGAYEWTVWFENTSGANTGVISDVKAADMVFPGENPILRGILGDHQNQYKPYECKLSDGGVNHKSTIGKPTHNLTANLYIQCFELNGAEEILSYNGITTSAVNTYGKGKAVIIGSYIGHNGTAYRNEASNNFVKKILSFAGIERADNNGVNMRERCADGKKAYIIFNTTSENQTVSLPIDRNSKYLGSYGGKISEDSDGIAIECEPLDIAVIISEPIIIN